MLEFHAWIRLAESTYEDDDELVERAVAHLHEMVAEVNPRVISNFDLRYVNGSNYLTVTGHSNHVAYDRQVLDEMVDFILRELPGSYGLIYERNDERVDEAGVNAFLVRVIARGKIETRLDPFLSPCVPVIEDPEPDEDEKSDD